jgi:organic radical activating enzyme
MLPLMEAFYSIQGEGFNTGKAAYFVRIGGCDVGCYWCDVKESWNADIHPPTSTDEIIEIITKNNPSQSVVVTGGEPLKYNLGYLCSGLKKHNIKAYLETSGSEKMTGNWDWVCLSPKKKCPPLPESYIMADELKVIIYDNSDFEWAEENVKFVKKHCKLILQPEWSKRKTMMPLIVDYILTNPIWNISLQSHKYMNIP